MSGTRDSTGPSSAADASRPGTDLSRALDELRAARREVTALQNLETVARLGVGIVHEINTPTQYVTDNVSFLQRAFDKPVKLVEAQSDLIEAVRNGESTALVLDAADSARRDVKLDYLARQVPRAVEQSLQGLEEISSIVKAIKEFSQPSGAEKQLSDLHDLIECVSVVTRGEWRYVAELELAFDWNLPAIPLLRHEFARALVGLVLSAAHAIAAALPQSSNHKGRLVIGTKLIGEQVEIRLVYSGRGALTDGVPFARAVVDKHGGSLELATKDGAAASVVIHLPLSSP